MNAFILVQTIMIIYTDLFRKKNIENADDSGGSVSSDVSFIVFHFISLVVILHCGICLYALLNKYVDE